MSDAYGPFDFVILEMPSGVDASATATALENLVDAGIVRLLDLLVVHKDADGSCREVDLTDGDGEAPSGLARFAGARSRLLAEEDVAEAAKALEVGTDALILLYENRWAAPFVSAARQEGAEVVASSRIPAQDIMDALDLAEAKA